jgi:hypothetical protein
MIEMSEALFDRTEELREAMLKSLLLQPFLVLENSVNYDIV